MPARIDMEGYGSRSVDVSRVWIVRFYSSSEFEVRKMLGVFPLRRKRLSFSFRSSVA